MRIAFHHGWASDHTIWQPLSALLPEFATSADDRGYFGAPRSAAPADIAVTHSFGTLRAIASPPAGCRGIVAINGFDRFAASAEFPSGVPVRILDRMIAALSRDAAAVVDDFRARCGAPPALSPPSPEPLREDLRRLRDEDCRGRWNGPLLVIDGSDDPIVSPEHRAACFAGEPGMARLILAGAGHLAPLLAAAACAAAIRSFAGSLA